MRRYFSPNRFPVKSTLAIGAGFFVLLLGSGSNNDYLVLVGAALLFIGIGALIALAKAKPSDREYDEWVASQARAIVPIALRKLNLDRSQLIQPPIRADSFVLPGSEAAEHYPGNEVRMKQGKDGTWRFSIHVYTYFFAAEHYIAVFTGDVNALHQSGGRFEETEEYFYRDIVGATMAMLQDTATIEGNQYRYRMQKFSLRISNGDVIDLGAYVSAAPLGNYRNAPVLSLPSMNIDRTLARLRELLRSRKQSYI